ncbi:MAG: hypothetical protein FJW96_13705 [Actinobacteria bacterium]|nr:hypothetical protein [Actinomycetota bacterium]
MALDIPSDLPSLTEREIGELINGALKEERRISDRRRRVQDRLDFLRSGGAVTSDGSTELVDKLTADEREVSEERRQVHVVIDLLYAERTRRGRRGDG